MVYRDGMIGVTRMMFPLDEIAITWHLYLLMSSSLLATAITHLTDTVRDALEYHSTEHALVIYDMQCPLTVLITDAYRQVLPEARFMDFDQSTPGDVMASIQALQPRDLVILVQSTNFRLNEFRLRIGIFERGLKTIEHLHLARMSTEQYPTYVDALAYDRSYYRQHGPAIKTLLDTAKTIDIVGAGTVLHYTSEMEEAKLNIGDYRGMKNVGGTFPIGEVFTEPKMLDQINGEIMIFGFAGFDHMMQIHTPFKAIIRDGILVDSPDAPEDFKKILDMIRAEERVMVRELGLGLNRALGKDHPVNDVTAFERMKGVHMSLGEKHGVYKKPGLVPGKTRYHVDIFLDVDRIIADDRVVFEHDNYVISI